MIPYADQEPQDEDEREQHQEQPPPLFENAATTTGNRPYSCPWERFDEHFGRGVLINHRDVEANTSRRLSPLLNPC